VKVLRWLLLFPAVIAVPAVVAALGNAIATFAAGGCPADRFAAGVCVAASHGLNRLLGVEWCQAQKNENRTNGDCDKLSHGFHNDSFVKQG
jgi:hypothetical protein